MKEMRNYYTININVIYVKENESSSFKISIVKINFSFYTFIFFIVNYTSRLFIPSILRYFRNRVFYLIVLLACIDSADILAIFPLTSYSIFSKNHFEKLTNASRHITFRTSYLNFKFVSNCTVIDTRSRDFKS